MPAGHAARTTHLLAPLRAKCRRLLGNATAAEDVAQETYVRFLHSGPTDVDDPRVVLAWLYRTGTRLAIDVLRDRKRVVPGEEPMGALPCRTDVAATVAARTAIAALASTVPADELEVAVLCRVDGLTHAEAAEVAGISERTVRRMLDRFDERTAGLRKELSS